MTGTGIIEEIKSTFKEGSMLTRLIYINLGVFLVVKVFDALLFLFGFGDINFVVKWLAVPAELSQLLYKPWTVISYMFLHQGFVHILFNLWVLYFLGKIFLEYFTGKQLLNVYLLGGIVGAALYVIAYNVFPVFSLIKDEATMIGASAGVMAVVLASVIYVPNYTVYILFLGPVKLKYIGMGLIIMDIALMPQGNAGGHISHLGGAIFGYFYSIQLKQGKDISKGFGKFLDSAVRFFKPKSKLKVSYKRGETDIEYNTRINTEQKTIDKILEKIAKSGYESLSKSEKEILFRQSRNN